MLEFEAVEARKGDALIVRWGTPAQAHTLVVDGGPSPIWATRLLPRLEEIAGVDPLDGQRPVDLDLVVVSHVDDDHIQGVLDLTNQIFNEQAAAKKPTVTLNELWHNSFDDHEVLPELAHDQDLRDAVPAVAKQLEGHAEPNAEPGELGAIAQSVAQGRDLMNITALIGVPRNPGFDDREGFVRAGAHFTRHGMEIEVLAPNSELIAKLKAEWKAKLEEILEKEADAKKAAPQAIVASFTDKSAPNVSSIVLLLSFDQKTLLLTGDARGDHVLSAISHLRPAPDQPIEVDLFKVPHHGSIHSNGPELFGAVKADHYVISGNGEHGNPHPQTLRDLFASRAGEAFTLHLTNHPEVGAVKADDRAKAREAQEVLDDAATSHPDATIVYRDDAALSVAVPLGD